MFRFAYNSQEQTFYCVQAYEKLYSFYNKLEDEAVRAENERLAAVAAQKAAEEKAAQKIKGKHNWQKIAVGELILLGLTGFFLFN